MTSTPNLHDATLLDLSLNWDAAGLLVRFRVFGPRVITLTAQAVKLLHCPHEAPWGPSVSVNAVRGPLSAGDGVQRVEIEVQSGDAILIEARGFEWGSEAPE